jgi:hypothetical protein
MPVGRASTTTAGADPRTASTIILFEEFVPFEYRQQLASSHSGRRRFRSLFSASKKQWKPAPTLNGRPYAVGQVPHPASFRELEFEGLLRGSTSTKVISLASQRRSGYQTVSRVTSTVPDLPGSPRHSDERAHGTPVKKVKSNEEQSGVTTTPQAKRMSRFRLPGGIPVPSPGGGRKTGMMPSEYSTVDFETRLASYSDDELNTGGHAKKGSKEDAWVDILVGSQDRRIGGQEAEFRKAGVWELKGGISEPELPISDPELASQEVAQALAAARELAPSSDGDDVDLEPVHDEDTVDEIVTAPRNYDREYDHEYDHGFNNGYDHTYHPEYDEGEVEGEEEEEHETDTEAMLRQKRRVGYFDLHPERRPVGQAGGDDEDPRARLHADSDEEPDDEEVYGGPEVPLNMAHDGVDVGLRGYGSNSLPGGPRQIAIPEAEHGGVKITDLDKTRFLTGKTTTSKTAALIEMYREKERGVPISAPQPSRLPVRAGSIPKDPLSASAVVPQPPSPSHTPPAELERIIANTLDESTRYVHGAPLHNVLEEEEEEP